MLEQKISEVEELFPKHLDPFIKVFLASQGFFWFAWNLVVPLFVVFASTQIIGGNIQTATSILSVYYVARVASELVVSKMTDRLNTAHRINMIIFGMVINAAAYFGFIFSYLPIHLYLLWIISGIGMGIALPASYVLFAAKMNKGQGVFEWAMQDTVTFTFMGLATFFGGVIVNMYGFKALFIAAVVINLISIIPFVYYLRIKR